MSQSRIGVTVPAVRDRSSEVDVVTDEADVQTLLDLLDDPDCREILTVIGESALSASEVSEACELPLSTTYRKLERLVEAGLLEEGTRIRRSGKHTSEFTRSVSDIVVSMHIGDESGLQASYRDSADVPESGPAVFAD